MSALRGLWAILSSRWLWSAIGLICLSALIWVFGPLLALGQARLLEGETARLATIAVLVGLWLLWIILRQRRAIRANRLFVSELTVREAKPAAPGEEALAAVRARFEAALEELKRRKLGRRMLREMPWYVVIGPPAAGKTTALRQSGLSFAFDPSQDLQGVGGTRNCDWFFTEDAVLIDTAGRYVLQESAPEADAAEWRGFLDLLRKHRGRRALNGVILALPVDLLAGDEPTIRAHGREIRKRLAEIEERLQIRLPVYLLITKADLIRGFEASFEHLPPEEREQVWGATFGPNERPDGAMAVRELDALVRQLDARAGARMEAEDALERRAEIFRFPAQTASLGPALRILVDTVFGESRYESSAWLRGFYLTSATQEGTPIDRLIDDLSTGLGLPRGSSWGPPRTERRSFFLRRLLTDLVFPEAGLATLDPAAEERRVWLRRGGGVAAATLASLAALGFVAAYFASRGAVAAQVAAFDRLQGTLAEVAARQAPVEPSDIDLALAMATAVENARAPLPPAWARWIGPSAAPQIAAAQQAAYDRALRDILEPRMVALLEATMWRNIRNPDFLLGGLKSYRMMTGLSQFDLDDLQAWWTEVLPDYAPTPPFPTEAAHAHQMAALARMTTDPTRIAPDEALTRAALAGVCAIPLARRAYDALLSDPAAATLPDWTPAAHAGPNGAKIFIRRSGKSLRTGVEGVFTYAGFHDHVLPRLKDTAAEAALDRSVFAGGCDESAEVSVNALSEDMLKLYFDGFITQWDALLSDIALAPLTDLRVASENLQDLASGDSALRRLLTAAAAQTDLARPPETGGEAAPPAGTGRILAKLGKLGKLARTGAKFVPSEQGPPPDTSGQPVSDHFKPLRATISEVDGAPPALDGAAAALDELARMLRTVAASPDPEQAIQRQGGLAELIAAVANQAAQLPDPLDDWLAGIGGLQQVTAQAVADRLNAVWRADILPFCVSATAGRYPFATGSSIDVTREDFQRLFGPGGLFDAFTNELVAPYADLSVRPWRWREGLGLDPQALVVFERARTIRDALFPGGAGPIMNFSLTPRDLSPNAARVSLVIDNQPLAYFNNAAPAARMTWPGRDATDYISLAFQPLDGSPDVTTDETGTWALLRLLRKNGLKATPQPERFDLRLAVGGYSADFMLQASSVANPFDLRMFSSFACPERL